MDNFFGLQFLRFRIYYYLWNKPSSLNNFLKVISLSGLIKIPFTLFSIISAIPSTFDAITGFANPAL